MSIEAMKKAKSAMVSFQNGTNGLYAGEFEDEIEALDKAIEQAHKQEPVAWITQGGKGWLRWHKPEDNNTDSVPLYTSPPQRQPLTDEMVTAAARELCKIHAGECQVDEQDTWTFYSDQFKRDAQAALKAAHGIKGKA